MRVCVRVCVCVWHQQPATASNRPVDAWAQWRKKKQNINSVQYKKWGKKRRYFLTTRFMKELAFMFMTIEICWSMSAFLKFVLCQDNIPILKHILVIRALSCRSIKCAANLQQHAPGLRSTRRSCVKQSFPLHLFQQIYIYFSKFTFISAKLRFMFISANWSLTFIFVWQNSFVALAHSPSH